MPWRESSGFVPLPQRRRARPETAMTKHNTYFDGGVQSLGYERNGRKATVGVIQPGSYHFGTAAPERMTVTSGELLVKRDGTSEWVRYPGHSVFEIAGNSGFDVKAEAPATYLCEFL